MMMMLSKVCNQGEPIVFDPNNIASIAYRDIARRILGESIPLKPLEEAKTGVFTRIKKLFGVKS